MPGRALTSTRSRDQPINRVTLAKAGANQPRRDEADQHHAKSRLIETKTITRPDGTSDTVTFCAQGGALGVGRLADDGSMTFDPLRRVRPHRRADKASNFRWYNDYRLPPDHGGGIITVRL